MSDAKPAAAAMDGIYYYQRHIYDATRAFYLLGRDTAIARLDVPTDGTVLEVACGTGRNLIRIAACYPSASLFGLDVSEAMLTTARRSIVRRGLQSSVTLASADATSFDPNFVFARNAFDRVLISYALSMIPDWRSALDRALGLLNPQGQLHIVDFGDFLGLPAIARRAQLAWLGQFSVTPIPELAVELDHIVRRRGLRLYTERLYGGYALQAKLSAG